MVGAVRLRWRGAFYMKSNFFTEIKQDGSLHTLKYMLIGIVIFAIIGAGFGLAKVTFLEQSPSGRYAVHTECVEVDYACVDACEADRDPWGGSSSCNCCLYSREMVTPLGNRLREQAKLFALIFGSFGFTVGIVYGSEKWKNRKDNDKA